MINLKEQNSEKRLSNEEVIEIIHEFQQGNFDNAETLLNVFNNDPLFCSTIIPPFPLSYPKYHR